MADKVRFLTSEGALWDSFVVKHLSATFCHLSSWKQVIETAYHQPCHYLYCQDERGITGVLPVVHVRGLLAPNRLVSVPFLDQGGILAHDSEAHRLLLEAGLELVGKVGAKGIDLRYSSPIAGSPSIANRRYRFVVNLPESSEQLWKSLGSKVRNQIRKAQKSGLETRAAPRDELSSFYEVFSRNMRDLGSPTHSEGFFRLMADALDERFSLYLTTAADGSVVAGAIAIRFADKVTVPWASSLRSARAQCPNHSFYWQILQDAIESEASEFDFGRSTQGSGTYSFKKQWATVLRPLGWEFLNRRGQAEQDYLLRSSNSRILPRSWQTLPTPIAKTLGPWVRRQLPN